MSKLLLLGSAALLTFAAPALAKPGNGQGGGHGNGKQAAHGPSMHGPSAKSTKQRGQSAMQRTDRTDRMNRTTFVDRNRDGIDDRQMVGGSRLGGSNCPPGLANKNNGCLPPGQAKKLYNVGQRLPAGYDFYTPYSSLPNSYYDQYGLDDDYRYINRNGYLYEVDPTTRLVRRVISLLGM
jgi:hypothetical protein